MRLNRAENQWTVWIAEQNAPDSFFKWSVHETKRAAEDDANSFQKNKKVIAKVTSS